jgi:hypothetical protein
MGTSIGRDSTPLGCRFFDAIVVPSAKAPSVENLDPMPDAPLIMIVDDQILAGLD